MPDVTEEGLHPLDVKRTHVLTETLNKRVDETKNYDVPFAPIVGFNGRRVKVRVRDMTGSGLAAFKTDDGSTPVVPAGGSMQELYFELVTIAEKDVINSSDLLALQSPDERYAMGAVRNIMEKAERLRMRNINRSRWMAWAAAKDELVIEYPNGAQIKVDWDFEGSTFNSHFSGSHKPTAEVAWNHQDSDGAYDADIVGDIETWTDLISDDLGVDRSECILHINGKTWRKVRRNSYLMKEDSPNLPQPRTAPLKMEEAASILDVARIEIINDYYLDDTGARTKHRFLADGKALLTAPYTVKGKPIMELKDGLVVMADDRDGVRIARNPGMRAEIYTSKEQVAQNVRVQTARLPIVNYPAAFVYATLWEE